MKMISKILYTILFIRFFCIGKFQSLNETDEIEQNYDSEQRGYGYHCIEKHEEYRKKFSSVKSIILTDKNYKEILNKNNIVLLYIHSACTQESHDFIPIIKYISEYYYKRKDDPNSAKIATMEVSDDESNINNQYNFRSNYYPFILLKTNEEEGFISYNGYYTAHSIFTFITKFENKNEIIQVNNNKILDHLLSPALTYLSIIAFNKKYLNDFGRLSEGLPYILFGICTEQKICEEKFGKNVVFSDFALIKMTHVESDFEENPDNKKIIDGKHKPEIIEYNYTNFQKLKEFIYVNALPKVFNFTEFNHDLMTASLLNSIIYVKGRTETKTNAEISQILKKAINLKNSKIAFGGILDPTNNENEEALMDSFRLELEDYSLYGNIIIQSFKNKEQELYRINIHQLYKDKGITENNLLHFVNEFNEGKLSPELKSENRPKFHPKDNLRMVVGRTFDDEITYNNDISIVLCLLTMNLTDLERHEKMIDILTNKLDALNNSLIFEFMDVGLNYMKDLPTYNSSQTPYYRYYYKNKTEGYDDFKGNYSNIEEIEEWIAVNFGRENGEGFDDVIRKYIQQVNEEMRLEEEEKKRKEEEFERDVEAGNLTSFELIMGDGSNEAINITQQKIQKILQKKMEIEEKKRKEELLKNKTSEDKDEGIKKETDL